MTKTGCLTLSVRAHELHIKGEPFISDGTRLKSWEEISWYFLFLWGQP